MASADDKQLVCTFLDRHLQELIAESAAFTPAQLDLRRRVVSVLVDRYCLFQPGLAWDELVRTPFGLCAVLDCLDELEQATARLVIEGGHGLETARAIEAGIDELRRDYVRVNKHMHPKEFIDCAALEHLPQPLFSLHRDRRATSMNAAARRLSDELSGEHCHEIFFASPAACPDCPLPDVLQRGAYRECAASANGFEPTIGLVPVSPSTALACVSAWEEQPTSKRLLAPGTGLLDSIGSGVVMLGKDGRVAFANRAASELLGGIETGARLDEAHPELQLNPDGEQRELRIKRPGSETLLGYRCVPCLVEGAPHVVVTLRDRSELRRLRTEMEQLQRLSEVGKMYASIAHEVRNPLAGILATIQSIEKEAAAAGLSEPMAVIEGEVKRLGNLLNSFFTYVRWQPPRRRRTIMSMVAERALRAAAPKLGHAIVETTIHDSTPVWIDPEQMEQVVLNLLLNASDAVARCGGRIGLFIGIERRRLVIRVQDDGCGIPQDQILRVFEAFYTTKPHGTGLGLAVCYRIVAAHGGRIDIESERNKGTRVTVQLPVGERVT